MNFSNLFNASLGCANKLEGTPAADAVIYSNLAVACFGVLLLAIFIMFVCNRKVDLIPEIFEDGSLDDVFDNIVPECSDVDDEIDISHKYTKGHRITNKDREKKKKIVEDKKKKSWKMARRRGMRKLKPEMDAADLAIVPYIEDREVSNLILSLRSTSTDRDSSAGFLVDIILRASSFLLRLRGCTDLQSTVCIFSSIVLDCVKSDIVFKMIGGASGAFEPESPFDPGTWYRGIHAFRNNTQTLSETPGFNVIKKCLIILVFTGVADHMKLDETGYGQLVTRMFDSVDKQADISEFTFIDAILEVLEFSFAAVDAFMKGNSMKNFLFPKSAVARLAELSAWYNPFRQGLIDKVANITPQEYAARVASLTLDLEMALAGSSLQGSMRVLHLQNYKQAVQLKASVESFVYSNSMRVQPPASLVFGTPGTGKSNICMNLHACVLAALGLDYNPSSTFFMKEGDKYDSGLRNDVTCFTADDVGNIKDDNVDPSETCMGQIIAIVNNVPSPSNQAAVEDKGKIFHSPLSVVGTTNLVDGGLHRVTHVVASYKRRISHIEVAVCEEYANADGGINAEAVNKAGRDNISVNKFRTYEIAWTGTAVRQVNVGPWMKEAAFYKHYTDSVRRRIIEQRDYVRYQNGLYQRPRCVSCGQVVGTASCGCSEEDIQEAEFIRKKLNIQNALEAVIPDTTVNPEFFALGTLLDSARLDAVLRYIVDHDWSFSLTVRLASFYRRIFRRPLPSTRLERFRVWYRVWWEFWTSRFYYYFVLAFARGRFSDYIKLILCVLGIYSLSFSSVRVFCILLPCILFWPVMFLTLAILTYDLFSSVSHWSRTLLMACQRRRIEQGNGTNPMPFIALSIIAAVSVYKMISSVWKQTEFSPETIDPKDMVDVEERQKEENPWLVTYREKIPAPMELNSMTFEQVKNAIPANLVRMKVYPGVTSEGKFVEGQGFFVNQNIVLVPHHIGAQEMYNVQIQREPFVGGKPNHTVARAILYNRKRVDETDFAKFNSDTSFPFANMLKFFPERLVTSKVAAVMITMKQDKYIEQDIMWNPQYVCHSVQGGQGSRHRTKYPTVAGDCMSVIISRSQPHVILGFHMGSDGAGEAMAFSVTKGDLIRNFGKEVPQVDPEQLDRLGLLKPPEVELPIIPEMDEVTTSDETDESEASLPRFCETRFGLDKTGTLWTNFSGEDINMAWGGLPNIRSCGSGVIVELEVENHPRSCVNYLMRDELKPPHMAYYGYDKKFISRPVSQVKTSILSPYLVAEGFPNKWGPPTFKSGRDHSTYLQLGTKPIDPVNPMVLDYAKKDYYYGVVEKLQEIDYPKYDGPITLFETLNGVPGDRFIKPVDENTAAGLGFGKKKKNHLEIKWYNDLGEEVEPMQGRKVLYPSDYLRDAVKDALQQMCDRQFMSMFVRSALKDEPAKIKEDGTTKIRIFGVLSFQWLLLGKMLFARVASALLSIPTVAEMYQGISVLGHDWTEFYSHIIAFEPTQVGEGDYSKYDTSISGQMLRAAGDILINVARFLGHDELWLVAMTSYIESLALNAWVFNGAIFIVDGWNPSGNWLTAIFAGMVNSLLHRMVFYQHVRKHARFRNYVHLAVLGDDSLFSTICPWYNCLTIEAYYASINMIYTPAEKDNSLKPFVKPYDATFGKRKFRWEPAYSCFVAPLDKDSIFKSLHNYMQSETDPMTIAVCVVDQALIEFVRHGKLDFCAFQQLMRRVCSLAGIDHMILYLGYTYEEMLQMLFERQFDQYRIVHSYGSPATRECPILPNSGEI